MLVSAVMKYLGIDYGSKRVGLATSDDSGALAFPKEVLKNNSELIPALELVIKNENIEAIVLGDSISQSGQDNPFNKKVKMFKEDLEQAFSLPVFMQNEAFTSFEAHGGKGKDVFNSRQKTFDKPKMLDASAAALILQRYLDKAAK